MSLTAPQAVVCVSVFLKKLYSDFLLLFNMDKAAAAPCSSVSSSPIEHCEVEMSHLASIFLVIALILVASVLSVLIYDVLNCGSLNAATPRGLSFVRSAYFLSR